MRRVLLPLLIVGVAAVTACAGAANVSLARWQTFAHVHAPVDLVGPRADGSLVLAAAGRLRLLAPSGALKPFAPAYRGGGGEPYIALSKVHAGCGFGPDVYALELSKPHGVLEIAPSGRIRRFVRLPAAGLENGIAFDPTGRFGHCLLVTVTSGARTTVYEIAGHAGKPATITSTAPRIEGGIAVAPSGFGRYGGDLITPDELSGKIFAITPAGQSLLIATSDVPHGQDFGVESEAFVPNLKHFRMLLADRRTPGNPHPGDDLILSLSRAQLLGAGVQGGDLLLASEGGAQTDAVRCSASGCAVRHVADGPAIAHAEGHIAVLPG